MNKSLIFFFALFLAFPYLLPAQVQPDRNCATNQANALLLQHNPEYKQRSLQVDEQAKLYLESRKNQKNSAAGDTITVVFHVVYNNAQQNITDAQILSQLQILNEDFNQLNADTINIPGPFKQAAGNPGIYFCMASLDPDGNPTTGITRTATNRTSFRFTENQMKFTTQGGHNIWKPELYLNIWVCNLADNVLGYAQFPGGPANTDGIVLRYSSLGKFPFNTFPGPYNQGRTATHEIGHWLGLRHIWGENEDDCTDSDQIADTPNQAGKSSGCPKFPKISCNNGPNGDMFMNFMDYTNDNCMHLFTRNQSEKMNAVLQTSRNSLLASNMCSDKLNADFRAEPDAIFPGESTSFFYYPNGRRPTSFLWQFEGATPSSSTEKDPKNIRYDNAGSYTVTLTVSDGTGSDIETKVGYLKVTSRELQLYPNPPEAFVTIASPAGTKMKHVWIYSTSGQLLFESNAESRELEVDVRSFRNGVYVVRAQTTSDNFLGQLLLINR